ncbi:methyltransferase domain-containing protein [Patescibacteria group bacterium]|nr:methyltransferase domain-containing protein [Patescibacteria group bacterium]MBU1682967.1 methyltransferase domain-containing protein [Patescibacteria group bacterium]MBU1934879.1 methyltransferase domain-containing protein [Patescibacteria group bacterium]
MRKKLINQIKEKVKTSYSAIAHEFDATRKAPWQEFNHFLAYTKHGGNTLDLGCGNGRLYEFLKQKKVNYLGVDHNSHLLEKAKENFPEARFQLEDMMDANLPEGAFDNIFCIAAFHHVPDKKMRKKVANDIYRTLKTDGILILTVWNLFQFKYLKAILRAIGSCVLHLGLKTAWNDLWIKWGNYPMKRYYHAFLPKELLSYFASDKWKIEEFYFTRKGNRVSFLRSFNLVLIARKLQ